ncbi:MAG: VOC family protein [Saccharospirillaceae bacterium]|nr:VOC family protein [Saccharospirillaceae bacterium]MCD8532236.1 VOC family protein [Saccharospirillaceae bacterium]
MLSPNLVILYVNDARRSAGFYARLLDWEAVEATADFALFAPTPAFRLGVWSRHEVQPKVSGTPFSGGGEIAIPVADAAQVDRLYADWSAQQVAVAQPPVMMDFGYTFTVLDPDGHRLRIYAPSGTD